MGTALDGVIRRTPDMNEVYFERTFNAPLEKLWRAVHEPESLSEWMGGPVDKLEPHVGGDVVIQIHPAGGATVYGKVLEFEPQHVLALTWDVPAWGNMADLFGTTMRWQVEADGNGSKILLTHALPHAVGREHVFLGAWHLHLDCLKELLENGRTIPMHDVNFFRMRDLYGDQLSAPRETS